MTASSSSDANLESIAPSGAVTPPAHYNLNKFSFAVFSDRLDALQFRNSTKILQALFE